jgi:hypothetical protein
MTHPSKRKGSRFEVEVVHALQRAGLAAEKVPLSGAVGGRFAGDVSVPVRGIDRALQCKRRRRSFTSLYGAIDGHYALVLRDDGQKPLVVLSLDDFAALALLPAAESE